MIRMTGIVFSRTQGGPQQRTFRPATTGPYATKRSDVVGGLSFLSEDMHNTLLATCEALLTEENDRCEPDVYAPTGALVNPAPDIEYDADDMQEEGI